MWFRSRRRSPPLDLSSLERSLERLAELVERLVALVPDLAAARPGNPGHSTVEPAPAPAQEEAPKGHVLFIGGPLGYRLAERDGSSPSRGDELEWEGARYRVLRLGASPLPGDRRRCAFLDLLSHEEAAADGLP